MHGARARRGSTATTRQGVWLVRRGGLAGWHLRRAAGQHDAQRAASDGCGGVAPPASAPTGRGGGASGPCPCMPSCVVLLSTCMRFTVARGARCLGCSRREAGRLWRHGLVAFARPRGPRQTRSALFARAWRATTRRIMAAPLLPSLPGQCGRRSCQVAAPGR